ncbi:hypothetical protein MUP32_02070 [Candidatus Microgenomates bacterium]|nr:hypothetical protein [Candidatus Microgenomates bacterium]
MNLFNSFQKFFSFRLSQPEQAASGIKNNQDFAVRDGKQAVCRPKLERKPLVPRGIICILILDYKKIPRFAGFFYFVAEPGVAPGLGDYEPPVQLYTTPRYIYKADYNLFN